MPKKKYLEAAKRIGFKSPLIDNQTFVGRKREINKIIVSTTGSQVTSVWISGPRRIGKTSLSHQIPKEDSVFIIRISFEKYEWSGIENFNTHIYTSILKNDLQLSLKSEDCLSQIASNANCNRHLILIFDEFDKVALNLQKDEQAYIRSILQENPYFGIIFITRLRPIELLQDYSDENSRLIGVCDILRLPLLKRDEVNKLLMIVSAMIDEPIQSSFLNWAYQNVGGYPIALQSLIRSSLLIADELNHFPEHSDIVKLENQFYSELHSEITSLWKDMPFDIRKFIIEGLRLDRSPTIISELQVLNLLENDLPVIPSFLVKVGNEIGITYQNSLKPEYIESAEKLIDGIRLCNEISLRKGMRSVFQVTQQSLRVFDLARPVSDENDLSSKIGLLHKICIESTNSNDIKGDDKCLIPKGPREVYKKSDGFEIIVAWRNFCFHDPSNSLKSASTSGRYKALGEICCRFLGPSCPIARNNNDRNIIYRGILNEINESVELLHRAISSLELS